MVGRAGLFVATMSLVSAVVPGTDKFQQSAPYSPLEVSGFAVRSGSAPSVASCIATHSLSRASNDAENDAQRGDAHLWAFFSQGDFLSTFVPGIDNCPVGGPMICRDRHGAKITYLQSTTIPGATCKSEPRPGYQVPPTIPNPGYLGVVGGPDACFSAVFAYTAAYNKVAASRHPELLQRSCAGKRASISPDSKHARVRPPRPS